MRQKWRSRLYQRRNFMIIADWVAVGVVLVSLALGTLIGFGRGLKFFTSGIFGFIIGVVVCALVGTVFLDVPFVADLLAKLRGTWEGIDFLNTVHMDIIIYYVIMFVTVQLLRIILVLIIKAIFESDNIVIKIVNRTLGAVLFLVIGVCIALLALKIVGWVGGTTAEDLYNSLSGSAFRLDELFKYITALDFPSIPPMEPAAFAGLPCA